METSSRHSPEELEKYKKGVEREKANREMRALNAKIYQKANAVFYIERKRREIVHGKIIPTCERYKRRS